MVLCIIAFFAFALMSVFSAKYRPLAKEAFGCVFRTVTLKPCDTGMDERIKAEMVSGAMKVSPHIARAVNSHYTLISWAFVLITFASFAYSAYGLYNFYFYGNCDGPQSVQACIINDLTGDYGRFSEPKDLIPPATTSGITSGDPSAPVTIIEFGCFTCPYTAQAQYAVKSVLASHQTDVYYIFNPFPLPSHANSYDTARGVLCANRQGRAWELQNLVFREQMVCTQEGTLAIKDLASKAGLDMAAFDSCYDDHETDAELDAYIEEGRGANIYATPTFFVNGKPLVGPKTVEEFESAIEEAKAG